MSDVADNRPLILVADEERRIAQALLRVAATHGFGGQIIHCEDGAAVLSQIDRQPPDAILASAVLPDMSGDNLFNILNDRFPMIVRFMMSDDLESKKVLKNFQFAHQVFPRPYDMAEILLALKKAIKEQGQYQTRMLEKIFRGLKKLPFLPRVYSDLSQELAREDMSFHRVAGIITRDVGISASILKMVNSPYFGLRGKVESIEAAVQRLGTDILQGLVLSASLMDDFQNHGFRPGFVESQFEHALEVALYASRVAKLHDTVPHIQETAFTVGLMHDLGKLVLTTYDQSTYMQLLFDENLCGKPLCERERECFEVDHTQVGAHLLGIWGIDDTIVKAVAEHHPRGLLQGEEAPLIAAVCAGNIFVERNSRPEFAVNYKGEEKILIDSGFGHFLEQEQPEKKAGDHVS